ncbi:MULTISPECIES: HAD family hydrolase [unclassified Paraflavitalea]|uniref:HAD family hydrolase n=1 Tax=unclassified Paraflavitalea TaxID=2798305 RepID=UPI003D347E76
MIKGFVFDLNGTMIDDMEYHIKAWHRILNDLGASISLERMKEECYGKNHELLERMFPGRFTYEEKDAMSYEKEKAYQAAFRPQLKLLPGLESFIKEAFDRGIKMSIGSAAIMFNIDFVLDGLNIRPYFHTLVSADDVSSSKPNPETFLKCAAGMGLEPEECLVFEDAPKGVLCAQNAGMKCIVIKGIHTEEEFADLKNITEYIDDYTQVSIDSLLV